MTVERIYAYSGDKPLFDFKMDLDPEQESDSHIIWYLEHQQLCEPELVYVMTKALRPGDLVVDGGANCGFFSLLASSLVGPEGRVIAYEPSPDNAYKFAKNIQLNECKNILLHYAGLWSERGVHDLYQHPDNGQHSFGRGPKHNGHIRVDTVTLNDTVEGKPRLIKLDIEGAEYAALRAADRLLDRKLTQFIVAELNLEALDRQNVTQFQLRELMFWDHDMLTWLIHDNGGLPTFVPRQTAIKPTKASSLVMFATPESIADLWPEIQI